MTTNLPSGTVTFLFTDIEGSTQLWEKYPDAMGAALARHDTLLHSAIGDHHGQVIKSTGDGLYAVFGSATDGVNAAVASQRALQGEAWRGTGPLHARMALHTGEAELREGDYFGPALNRTARLMAVGAGGQCLLSQATAAVVHDQLPAQVSLRDLGEHRLKDLVRPERVYQVVTPDLPADFPPLKSLNTYLHNLPVQLTSLVGREQELAETRRLLGATRLLTVSGPGGTGKTRLALQLAAEVLSDFPDGVYVAFLAPIRDADLVVSAVAQALGVQAVGGQPLRESVKAHLRERQLLLVLDNFEQILAAAPFVADLLATCPRLKVLVTSREMLHLYGEQEYPTPPLALPDLARRGAAEANNLSNLAQSPAVVLFVQRGATVKPGFALSPANATTVAEICIRLDGLPLALELAAAKLKLFPPSMLLAHLQQRLTLLTGGAHDLPARQRTLRDEIAWSYDLLADGEQKFFRRLSVFVGGFTLEAAQAVGASDDLGMDFLDALAGLVDKSLVRQLDVGSGEARFGMLETIREYGLEQLHIHAEESAVRQTHHAACLELFRTGDSHLRTPEAATWFARLELELDNLRAALQWALDEARYADAAWLVVAANWFWNHHGQWYEMGQWLAQLLPHRQELETDLRMAILVSFHSYAGELEDSSSVNPYREEMMGLADRSNKLLQAAVWFCWGRFLVDASESEAAWERSIALARVADEPPRSGAEFCVMTDRDFMLGGSLVYYADTYLIEQGEVERVASLARESYQLFTQNNRNERAEGLGALGRLALLRGDLAQAHSLLQEATKIATAANSEGLLASWQHYLGIVNLYEGNTAEARRLLNESLRLGMELKHRFRLAQVFMYLAELALRENDPEQAAQWLAQSLTHRIDARRITLSEVERLLVAARLATAQQHYARAATLFGLAEAAHSRIHYAIAGPRRALADDALASVRGALDPAVFAEAFAAGQQMSLEEAFTILRTPLPI